MDNYHASGKSSAEGHQWTDAGMVSDYVEKNIRAWFRSYPHRQEDALVYNKSGFIWNHALKFGKSVKVYGEACETVYNKKLSWTDLYKQYQNGTKPNWINTTTIDNLRPVSYKNIKIGKQDIGLIAHELQEVYPFLVTGEKDGENLQSVNYIGLIGILIKEIKELKSEVKILKSTFLK
jgi:hypothetical protein